MQNQHAETSSVARDNLAVRIAPVRARPFLKLARYDKPIGTWLLFFPCAWAFVLAITSIGVSQFSIQYAGILLLLGLGAVLMRGAGCSWNDILDRDIDKQVHRSKTRPLADGSISLAQAVMFLVAQLVIAFIVLLQFNFFTVLLALAAVPLVIFYPFAKRVTRMPQFVLGVTFAWGALAGWSAVTGALALAPVILYIGCIAWTVGYDTVYAHQDSHDDAILGLGSSALLWGESSRVAVGICYAIAASALALAAALAGSGWMFYACIPLIVAHLLRQLVRFDSGDASACLRVFQSNRDLGALVTLALALGAWSAA